MIHHTKEVLWMPDLELKVREWVKHCGPCIQSKDDVEQGYPNAKVNRAEAPGEQWHVDYAGPLMGAGGIKYWIWGAVDAFTRYLVTELVSDCGATTALAQT